VAAAVLDALYMRQNPRLLTPIEIYDDEDVILAIEFLARLSRDAVDGRVTIFTRPEVTDADQNYNDRHYYPGYIISSTNRHEQRVEVTH